MTYSNELLKEILFLLPKMELWTKAVSVTVLSSRDIPFLRDWREQPQLLDMSFDSTTNFAS